MYGDIWYINRQALFLITIKYQTVLSAFKNLRQKDLQSGIDDSEVLGCVVHVNKSFSLQNFSLLIA
jgi:hypothetical protein